MNQRLALPLLLLGVALLTMGLVTATAAQPEALGLVKVSLRDRIDLTKVEASGIPVYARLTSGGESYLLAGATTSRTNLLRAQGLDVTLLDRDLQGASYYLAHSLPGRPRPSWKVYGQLLLDDGRQALLRVSPHDTERLTETGVEIAALPLEPISLHPQWAQAIPDSIEPDPDIAAMMAQVDQATLYQYAEWLTGEDPAVIGGQPYTIVTRNTYSGTPVQKAAEFAHEHFQGLGLQVDYDQWGGSTYPNVIATKPGLTDPQTIYVICAHLDDMPYGPLAPGADDNASGVVGVLAAADILSRYDFGCTLKFALWTGEEQGLLGSDAWAEWAGSQGLHIRGVINMDMIAYDSDASPTVDLHARSWLPDSVAIANLFAEVVDVYGLGLVPAVLINDSLGDYSDNKSFWDEGYAAILAIEDFNDFTPYYHTVDDTLSTLNMTYFAEFIKGSLGTFVHMSGCLIPGGLGYLDGHVTSASDAAPIAGATLTMIDSAKHTYHATTDASGYYTRALAADTYTVTASADGFLPSTITDVVILAAGRTPKDFVLQPTASCDPVEILTVTTDITDCIVTFGAELTGSLPFSYSWDFGDLGTSVEPTETVNFDTTGSYPYNLTVLNCGAAYSDTVGSTVTVTCDLAWSIYLPLVVREG